MLVATNLLFVGLGVALSITALMALSDNKHVRHVQARLNMTGLTAQLLEGVFAQRKAKNDKQLFKWSKEGDETWKRRVSVE